MGRTTTAQEILVDISSYVLLALCVLDLDPYPLLTRKPSTGVAPVSSGGRLHLRTMSRPAPPVNAPVLNFVSTGDQWLSD
jgi:hypothetical protein